MKQIFSIGIILCLSMLQLKAQSDFRNGYIIKNNNDTIYGLINYKGSKASAVRCTFKKDNHAEKQFFSPDEITSYRFIDGKYYVSKNLTVGDESERLFLEYLINGIVDIYYYRDGFGIEHYMADNGNDSLLELKNEQKEVFVDNIRYLKESKEYIGMLKVVFKDSPLISKKAETISLNHKSLIKIAHEYHSEVCKDEECIIYEKKLPALRGTYGVVAGLNGIFLSQPGELNSKYYYMQDSHFGFSFYPSIGLFYKVNMPFINERLFLQYEGTFSRVKLTTSNSYIDPVYNMNYLNDIRFTQNAINNLVVLKYEYPRGKIRPTLQFGGLATYSFRSDFERNLEVKYSWGNTYYTDQMKDDPFYHWSIGFVCGIGLRSFYHSKKEIYLDIRYQTGTNLVPDLNTNIVSVNLGFKL